MWRRMHDPRLDHLIGTVVVIDDNDYMYGVGTLRLRLRRITLLRSEPGWALVAGVAVDFRGTEHDARDVTVRVRALQDQPPEEP